MRRGKPVVLIELSEGHDAAGRLFEGAGKYGRTLTNLWIGNKTLSEFLLNTDLARKYAGDRKPWGR